MEFIKHTNQQNFPKTVYLCATDLEVGEIENEGSHAYNINLTSLRPDDEEFPDAFKDYTGGFDTVRGQIENHLHSGGFLIKITDTGPIPGARYDRRNRFVPLDNFMEAIIKRVNKADEARVLDANKNESTAKPLSPPRTSRPVINARTNKFL